MRDPAIMVANDVRSAHIHAVMDNPPTAADSGQLVLVQRLFIENMTALRGMVRALVPDKVRVDDIVQETFLTVTAKAAQFREGTSFRAWVFTVARYKVLESLRKNRLEQALSAEVVESLCGMEELPLQPDDRVRHLAPCIERLAPQARRAIELRYQRSHELPEVARIMGWTTGAVKVALSRARAVLRECVERRMAAEPS